ncbi:DNA-binding response regulator [Candidatus Epulonipiscium fishelsonii]|uniref:DNA-binding response regulator n=1 Tax=Candidatus Epulonipiscium fishelsonii TaxID=77094 RepID=A0ACC8XA59_9FIRM|nr:DNA-binding response regulator [Epulopiscium sp. SCG-B11WGA-EpuloA1]ONI42014.1 DNA-binding response regulator [Epulopiscium sp. SCG-B05WGA-EpuloA1]
MDKYILLVEDDVTIALGITTFLSKQNLKVKTVNNLKDANKHIDAQVSLILLDLTLPDGISFSFCKHVKSTMDIPIIFITVCDNEEHIIQGLDLGADDYITKPFSLKVLYSRIKAVLRRQKETTVKDILTCDNIQMHLNKNMVICNGEIIKLSANEYKLLKILLTNKNCNLSRLHLLDKLWDANGNFVNDNTLTVTMKRLREKLANPECIKTIRGTGYLMEDTDV